MAASSSANATIAAIQLPTRANRVGGSGAGIGTSIAPAVACGTVAIRRPSAAMTAEMPMKQGNADEWREKLRGHGLSPTEDPEVLWNFEKFLIGRDGRVAARFSPAIPPEDISLVGAIEVELAKAG